MRNDLKSKRAYQSIGETNRNNRDRLYVLLIRSRRRTALVSKASFLNHSQSTKRFDHALSVV